ncbi:MAG: hypothetical protein HKP09_04890 [Enterobacterales bacterium]|nr:hypothetical protein [Enterobacterales bacterium]
MASPSIASDSKSAHNRNQPNAFYTGLVKISAYLTIPIGEILATDVAEQELALFRTGEHDSRPIFFDHQSQATKELLEGRYYQELTVYLIDAMARWYGGHIPESDGLYSHSDTFRVFSPSDAMVEIVDGVDMADVVGTFTYYVRITSKEGKLTFLATNVMSLGSYAGENYWQYDKVVNPESGAFKSRVQVFEWQQDIPPKYRRP